MKKLTCCIFASVLQSVAFVSIAQAAHRGQLQLVKVGNPIIEPYGYEKVFVCNGTLLVINNYTGVASRLDRDSKWVPISNPFNTQHGEAATQCISFCNDDSSVYAYLRSPGRSQSQTMLGILATLNFNGPNWQTNCAQVSAATECTSALLHIYCSGSNNIRAISHENGEKMKLVHRNNGIVRPLYPWDTTHSVFKDGTPAPQTRSRRDNTLIHRNIRIHALLTVTKSSL